MSICSLYIFSTTGRFSFMVGPKGIEDVLLNSLFWNTPPLPGPSVHLKSRKLFSWRFKKNLFEVYIWPWNQKEAETSTNDREAQNGAHKAVANLRKEASLRITSRSYASVCFDISKYFNNFSKCLISITWFNFYLVFAKHVHVHTHLVICDRLADCKSTKLSICEEREEKKIRFSFLLRLKISLNGLKLKQEAFDKKLILWCLNICEPFRFVCISA